MGRNFCHIVTYQWRSESPALLELLIGLLLARMMKAGEDERRKLKAADIGPLNGSVYCCALQTPMILTALIRIGINLLFKNSDMPILICDLPCYFAR